MTGSGIPQNQAYAALQAVGRGRISGAAFGRPQVQPTEYVPRNAQEFRFPQKHWDENGIEGYWIFHTGHPTYQFMIVPSGGVITNLVIQ